MWPFAKNAKNTNFNPTDNVEERETATGHRVERSIEDSGRDTTVNDEKPQSGAGYDYGPFDGDSVDISDFDFSDGVLGLLNLGSMTIPLPNPSEVQVEMGENGPRMLHIVTEFGRLTPVAFAAPASERQWPTAINQIGDSMRADGLDVHLEDGDWGTELVGIKDNAVLRMIGCDGPRWMLRMTLAGPRQKADDLARLARDVIARTFVYRGSNPIMAGQSLPVVLPDQLAEQVKNAMEQQARSDSMPTSQPNASAPQAVPNPQTGGVSGSLSQPLEESHRASQGPSPKDSAPGSAFQQLQERNAFNHADKDKR